MTQKTSHDLVIKKPISELNRALQLDFKEFFKNLFKGVTNVAVGNFKFSLQNAIDALFAISVKERDCGEIAWLLIQRALHQAIQDLVTEHTDLITGVPENLAGAVHDKLDLSLEDSEVTIDSSFFYYPQNFSVIKEIQNPFRQWLVLCGLEEAQAQSICGCLPSYFVFALNDQWRERPQDYVCLKEQLETPFTKADETTTAWLRYLAWLSKQIDMPMFGEAFSLNQVYVALRAYFKQEVKVKQETDLYIDDFYRNLSMDDFYMDRFSREPEYERVAIDLKTEINDWLQQPDKDDAIRLISGGPGCGKSSFAKMLAAHLATQHEPRVLFVPLHHLNLKADLVAAVSDFVSFDQFLTENPFDPKTLNSRLLVIFDGLDELTMQGKAAAEVAQQFVREIDKTVGRFNQQETRVQVLITGREVVVQANASEFRKPRQILHVLPYFLAEGEQYSYEDSDRLLTIDQRDIWWEKYGIAKGQGYTKIPTELKRDKLQEITAQPLLNYLVALSFDHKKLDFSTESNLNHVYADLLQSVYQRVWENYQHPSLGKIKESQFIRILAEMAIATWHGDGRTTSVTEIEKRCEQSGLKKLLAIFEEGAKQGLTRLFAAFYFRQRGQRASGERTFEFTHKSFSEYLIAYRIVGMVDTMHSQLKRQNTEPDIAWDEKNALEQWASLAGTTEMDIYIFRFLCDEIRLRDAQLVIQWQQTLGKLIGYMLRHGMPMESLQPRPNYQEECRQARNAEETLLVTLNACARCTQKTSEVNWPSDTAFGEWIARLQGQRFDKKVLVFDCFSYLNLRECVLVNRDLVQANLEGAHFEDAHLERTHLEGAHLERAHLEGAHLERAHLEGAYLAGANLKWANLKWANLKWARLEGAYLNFARFEGANLVEADLVEANLNCARLKGAKLEGTKLEGANLKGTILEKS